MSRSEFSRRRFAQLAGSAAVAAPALLGQSAPLTAQQVIERIQKNAGVPWRPQTTDTFKAGDPSTVVKGIATTAMATMDVLTRATKENINLIITLEPVFFGQADAPSTAGRGITADDRVFAGKKSFIEKNGLVVFRFTDHWRARTPDPIATGLASALGWTRYQAAGDPLRYDLPSVTLASLAGDLQKRLKARAGIRVLGNPQERVRRIGMLPGLSPLAAGMKMLPECDVLVAGETREWETVEYASDTVASGQKKGMILLGRVLSEDPGMNLCAEWLKPLVREVPVRWLPAGDPYWRTA